MCKNFCDKNKKNILICANSAIFSCVLKNYQSSTISEVFNLKIITPESKERRSAAAGYLNI